MTRFLLAGLLILSATAAFAHSKLDTTAPPDGTVLAQAPARIVLSFAKRIRLTKVRMRHGDGPAVALDLTRHKGFATRFAIALPGRGRGLYRIEWRGLSGDGHAVRRTFAFRVQ